MAQSKRERYESNRDHIRRLGEKCERARWHITETADRHGIPQEELLGRSERGLLDPGDADAILEWCDGYDGENATATPNDADHETNRWGSTRSPSTLRQWLVSVSAFGRDLDGSLLEASTDELNEVAQRMYEGTAESVDKPLSKNTVRSRQNCMKKFLRHGDSEADPDDLMIFDSESTVVDPEDMLTREEFHALRQAPEHPRDRAIVDLFLYTGQRNTALRTLRVKDVDIENRKYRLNSEADGLKGADLIGTWNPLLGAVNSLRDWRKHHPDWDNPNAYVLTERRDSLVRDATSTISDDTVNRVLREAAKKAAKEEPGIANKPTHAHAMRHNFVTTAKRDYRMDDDVIKRLIRHKPESDVMNTTYAHLSDADYMREARKAMGYDYDEGAEMSAMTPENCDACGEPLPPAAKACSNCGAVYTPDALDAQETLEEDADKKKEEAETMDLLRAVDMIQRVQEQNPELLEELDL